MDRCSWRLAVMVVLLLLLGLLWEFSATLVTAKFKHGGGDAQLWFACMVSMMLSYGFLAW